MKTMPPMLRAAHLVLTLLLLRTADAMAQARCSPWLQPVFVDSEWERYLRVSQLVGSAIREPWMLRAFGPKQWGNLVPYDSAPMWAAIAPDRSYGCDGAKVFQIVPARAQLILNTGFPLGRNDGALWEGRGLTAAVEAGFNLTRGPLTVTVMPLAFVAQNSPFSLVPVVGASEFADWRNPLSIDLPQRFGDGAYAILDPGQSSIRVDISGVALGFTTANEVWGPAIAHPIVLGSNAPGFPRLFLGTDRPLRAGPIGRVHGRVFWGRLDESKYSPMRDVGGARLASGVGVVFQPNILDALEIGAARFFHVQQSHFTLNLKEILRPIRGETAAAEEIEQNQLLSVFARLVFPGDGVELYGEFGKEDRNNQLREFLIIPDHDAAYLLGIQKAWRSAQVVTAVRFEFLNGRVTHLALATQQTSWYVHGGVRQGHTNRGQALGSAALYGGGASLLAVDRYTRRGRVTFSWERLQQAEFRPTPENAPGLMENDVAHVWSASLLRFHRRIAVDMSVGAVYELNRQFRADAFSVRTAVSVTGGYRQVGGRGATAASPMRVP